MKNTIVGILIGLVLGSSLTYFLTKGSEAKEQVAIPPEETKEEIVENDTDLYKKEWSGFQIHYAPEMSDGRPLEQQELSILRDIDLENMENNDTDATKPVVVNYWASYCGPCLQEIPELIKLKNQNIGKASFKAVFSKKDKRKALINIINKTGFNWIQVADEFNQKNTNGIYPTTMVFSMITGELLFKKSAALNHEDFETIQKIIDENQ